ncbi:MAG: 30S ribosome-binding factor RbfA [Planctomycetota bacterium]|nr:30S ribosome-binding factor RbfA [Planctomycetota bacterium]MDI6786791.1 30S ribosome-binding factor RbfA [Planctomycetota bacterium]
MSFNRLERVNKELQREISQIILCELKDPRFGFITVIKVETSPDLQSAKVFVTVLDKEEKVKESVKLLNKASRYIQNILSKTIRMRHIPKLSFRFDASIEDEQKILNLLSEIAPSKQDEPRT